MTVFKLDKIETQSDLEKLAKALAQLVDTQEVHDLKREIRIGLREKKYWPKRESFGSPPISRRYCELYLTSEGLIEKTGHEYYYSPFPHTEKRRKINPNVAIIKKYEFTAEDINTFLTKPVTIPSILFL